MKNLILSLIALIGFTVGASAQSSNAAVTKKKQTVVKNDLQTNVAIKKANANKTIVYKKDNTLDKRYKNKKKLKKAKKHGVHHDHRNKSKHHDNHDHDNRDKSKHND